MNLKELEQLVALFDKFIGEVMSAHLEQCKRVKEIMEWELTGAKSTPNQKTIK